MSSFPLFLVQRTGCGVRLIVPKYASLRTVRVTDCSKTTEALSCTPHCLSCWQWRAATPGATVAPYGRVSTWFLVRLRQEKIRVELLISSLMYVVC